MAKIDDYLRVMVDFGASDLHLSSGVRPMYRVNGQMLVADDGEADGLTSEKVKAFTTEIMPELNRKEFEDLRDTDFAYELEGAGRFRVNAFEDLKGVAAVFRHIPDRIPALAELGLPPVIQTLCGLKKGLILVTGPTGSGKSTTLAAMLDAINHTRPDHIITIEDPIEFVHQNKRCLVNQREVRRHTSSFQHALRAALREDPDIVLVGEMRDLETTQIAIETAETGHLVLATLHTTTAPSTVDRIVDQFPAGQQKQIRSMLANSLQAVITQTLLRRADGNGRVAALEILINNRAVANHIREGKTHLIPSALQTGASQGMQDLNSDLLRLVTSHVVTPKEAYSNSVDKEAMDARLRSAGFML